MQETWDVTFARYYAVAELVDNWPSGLKTPMCQSEPLQVAAFLDDAFRLFCGHPSFVLFGILGGRCHDFEAFNYLKHTYILSERLLLLAGFYRNESSQVWLQKTEEVNKPNVLFTAVRRYLAKLCSKLLKNQYENFDMHTLVIESFKEMIREREFVARELAAYRDYLIKTEEGRRELGCLLGMAKSLCPTVDVDVKPAKQTRRQRSTLQFDDPLHVDAKPSEKYEKARA